ncbi:enoyl-CoA hydratase/carnithine racemase [Pseudomonas laurylsulfatiphila]|uniref:enoyl-CoA hydratase/isomerase family protein n=1 Tax=Pseudomonas laurylsulfatiphila TaxID=2011015 RepID=UPI003D1D0885
MTYQTLKLRRDGQILHVDFDNPPLNLMSIQMVGELFDLAGKLAVDRETKVVIFGSANPDFFIAHFDLNDILNSIVDPGATQSRYDDINALQAVSTMWQTLPQVTIGVVDGICRGGGLEFLLALSMRFTTPESRFCFPEASGGFLPAGGGTTRLAMQIGPARALEVMLSSRDFSGEEAAEYGIVNRAIPRNELNVYIDTLARSVAKRSPGAIAAVGGVIKDVHQPMVESLFAGFARENSELKTLLAIPAVNDSLKKLASLLDYEHELDLPATIAAAQ